jgi:hypothetical protein
LETSLFLKPYEDGVVIGGQALLEFLEIDFLRGVVALELLV